MFAEERSQKIIEVLKHKKKVTVHELSKKFNVSGATIRTQLNEMESAGLLIRTHGGAMIKSQAAFELTPKEKAVRNEHIKDRIAAIALSLIEDGDTIILDSGTTSMSLARLLEAKKALTVITNDIKIAGYLEERNKTTVIVIGGMLRNGFNSTVGSMGLCMLSGLLVDKAFMGTNSISATNGASTPHVLQAEIKKAMVSVSRKVIFQVENEKFGRDSFIQFASPAQIDLIITDQITAEDKEVFEQAGVELLTDSLL